MLILWQLPCNLSVVVAMGKGRPYEESVRPRKESDASAEGIRYIRTTNLTAYAQRIQCVRARDLMRPIKEFRTAESWRLIL